jgi:hypothetical protein
MPSLLAVAWLSDPAAPPQMPNRPVTLVLALLVLLAGCAGDDPQKTAQSLDSWSATVYTGANAVRRGWVPRRYGAQLRDRATAALNEAREKGAPDASPAEARAVAEAEQRLDVAVDTLRAVVGS